ncbi:MAG: purine-nucleoside phosphorylase [Actinobacteria bacterium]|jgi:purine-nucleoside phosphorylase|nr:purine-nucleoside phosphorylase [Actinomycetota bacterium]NCV41608.1 purine-nucleoside phosphorylase [Actinomycetota bacterium]NCV82020.1 purine-nucleoside phosphorylase [Actinomycetota bacterium]NCW43038.1 purine-nucleoside phosphorylase [Actinomycetota bacterium]NCW71580.1 purine-nucleoside phosphorylase [Actinomycetota bacterium]
MTNSELLYSDPLAAAATAAKEITERTGVASHDVALVMGSGWVSAVDALGTPAYECNTEDITGFLPPTVEGHSGKVRSYEIDSNGKKLRALVFLGRTHLYEGKGVEPVVHSVRTAVKSGCKVVILTNACGGINKSYKVGQPVLIRDHISLTAVSPLSGATFVDLTDLYSKRIREIVKKEDSSLEEGVYVHWRGPTYETPAEILMMRTMGADLVGMSTVPEAIAAHALGAEVLGISLVTNAAAGVTGEKLNHEEVIAAGKAAADRMGALLKGVIPKLF